MQRHEAAVPSERFSAPEFLRLPVKCLPCQLQQVVLRLFLRVQHVLRRKASELVRNVVHDKAHGIVRIRRVSQLLQVMVNDLFLQCKVVALLQRNAVHDPVPRLINELPLPVHALAVVLRCLAAGPGKIRSGLLCLVHCADNGPVPNRSASLTIRSEPLSAVQPDHLILQRQVEPRKTGIPLPAAPPSSLQLLALIDHQPDADDGKPAALGAPFSEPDIGSASRNGGGHRNCPRLSRLLNDRRLLRNVVGVQHIVCNAAVQQHLREKVRHLNGAGNYQHRLAALMYLPHLFARGK